MGSVLEKLVGRDGATLKDGLAVWRTRSLADLDVIYVYLDGFALRVRSAGKVVSMPVLGVIGVFPDGHKYLLALELCGGEGGSLERVPRRPGGARPACSDPLHHRRQSRAASHRRGGLAAGGGATLLRAQAPQPRAESPETRAARAWWRVCGKAVTSSSRSSVFPRRSGRHYGRRTRVSGSTRNFADA